MDENLTVESPGYASITGRRMFVQPNLFNKAQRLSENKNRQHDIIFQHSYRDVDSVFIRIPQGYSAESIPPAVKIRNQFGSYEMSCTVQGSTITLIRKWEQPEGRYPATAYSELVAYYEAMARADRAKLVLVKE